MDLEQLTIEDLMSLLKASGAYPRLSDQEIESLALSRRPLELLLLVQSLVASEISVPDGQIKAKLKELRQLRC
ncbi:hypothetical protein GCM10027275_50110 [Rhabdobacter roseus]|uniref:Uncharacterized protein n=1 Tax=Rhabdobacter roseus TaxID=1655419 RepID=A0A840U0I9_9BACT|nr:hypothetical protein [Rhabdobacter roseus]MBB5287083.1 hypothetical protein [Rhabdobacter roseus]